MKLMNLEELKALAKDFNIEVSMVGTNTIFLKSLGNVWYFYYDDLLKNNKDRRSKIYLYHESRDKEKEHFHCQRKYGKITHLLHSVATHDIHIFQERRKSKMEILFEQIEKSNNMNTLHNDKQHKNCKNTHNNRTVGF
jgi:hypothetical protein